MKDFSKDIDVFVCRPDAGITRSLQGVFVRFEHLDTGTNQGTGKPLGVAMPTEDAMWLLRQLQNLQQRYNLPLPKGDIVDVSDTKTH